MSAGSQTLGKILANLDLVEITTNVEKILFYIHLEQIEVCKILTMHNQDLDKILVASSISFFQKFSLKSWQDLDKILGTCTLQNLDKKSARS